MPEAQVGKGIHETEREGLPLPDAFTSG